MKPTAACLSLFTVLYVACPAQVYQAPSSEELMTGKGRLIKVLDKRLNEADLKVFLERRVSGQFLGKFSSYSGFLYTVLEVPIWTEDKQMEERELENWYPSEYRPTLREHLDVLARQVSCTWHYDFETGYFVFSRGHAPYPHRMTLQPGWTVRDQGMCIAYIPPTAPMGMDVYILGRVTADTDSDIAAVQNAVRNYVSNHMAGNFKSGLSESDFAEVPLAGVNARYFQASLPQKDGRTIIWRQWALVKNSWSILIVSAVATADEATVYSDVKSMLATFDIEK